MKITTMLTARQVQIIQHMIAGKSKAEICRLLCITPGTYNNHRNNILERLGANNMAQAVDIFKREVDKAMEVRA